MELLIITLKKMTEKEEIEVSVVEISFVSQYVFNFTVILDFNLENVYHI